MNTTNHRWVWLALLPALLAAQPRAFAGYKCWTDKNGEMACGNAVPPEYSQQKYEELNNQGVVIKEQKRAKTRAEIARERAAQARKKAEQERARKAEDAQALRDRTLLATYTTAADLERARDRRLKALDGRIGHQKRILDRLRSTLRSLREKAVREELGGARSDQSVRAAIGDTRLQIRQRETLLSGIEQDRADQLGRFAADLARYLQLKKAQASK